MQKAIVSGLICGGLVVLTVFAAAASSLCVLDWGLSIRQDFGPGHRQSAGIYERGMGATVYFESHAAHVPLPILKFTLLTLVCAALFGMAHLLRTLLRLHRRLAIPPVTEGG